MQTRRRRERRETLPLVLERPGGREIVAVAPADYPLYLPTPLFPAPGVVTGKAPTRGIFSKLDLVHIAGPSFQQVKERYSDATFVGARVRFSPDEFARMIAKVAFCGAIYVLGLAPFTNTPIRRLILGEDESLGHWVGCWERETVNEAGGLHSLQIRAAGTDVHVIVRLFAQFGAPEYHVVLGAADPLFVQSDAWPWK